MTMEAEMQDRRRNLCRKVQFLKETLEQHPHPWFILPKDTAAKSELTPLTVHTGN